MRSGFRPAWSIAAAVVAVAVVLGGCRDDAVDAVPTALPETVPDDALPAPPALALAADLPTAAAAPGPVTLALAVAPADGWTEALRVRQSIRQQGPGLPRGESEVRQELRIAYAPVTGDAAGAARLRARIAAASVETKPELPGVEAEATAALEGLAWTFRRDARGRTRDVAVAADAPAAARARFDRFAAVLARTAAPLPEGPVAAGDSWTVTTDVPLRLAEGATVTATVETTATFRGLVDRDGRTLAVVETALRQRLRGPVRAHDVTGAVVGAAHGRGVFLVDAERGAIVASETALGGRQELLVETADGRHHLVQEHTLHLTSERVAAE